MLSKIKEFLINGKYIPTLVFTPMIFSLFLCSKDCLSVFDVNLNIFHHVSLMILKGKVYRIKQRGQKKGKYEMIRGSEKKDRGKEV